MPDDISWIDVRFVQISDIGVEVQIVHTHAGEVLEEGAENLITIPCLNA